MSGYYSRYVLFPAMYTSHDCYIIVDLQLFIMVFRKAVSIYKEHT